MTTALESTLDQLDSKLAHILTEYDRKQSTKRCYNIYALGIMFQSKDSIIESLRKNPDQLTKDVICEHFNDRLLDFILKKLAFK